MSEELLPCPFCGSEATCWKDQYGEFGVACNRVMCFEVSDRFESAELATEWWNRRAPLPQQDAMPEDVAEWIERLVLAKRNDMEYLVSRGFEKESLQFAVCDAALAYLDSQRRKEGTPQDGRS